MAPRPLDFLKKWPVKGRFVLKPKKATFPEAPQSCSQPLSFLPESVCELWSSVADLP